jgi:hypothetical protein
VHLVSDRRRLRLGFDAGAETIYEHLARRHETVPSTIWRVLKARGFVTPQRHKRPKPLNPGYQNFVDLRGLNLSPQPCEADPDPAGIS